MATIQIADNDARVQYTQAITANSTQLTIDFPFFALDDIKVVVTNASGVDTTLSRGTGTGTFAVTGTAVDDGFSGGHITLGDSYANTTKTTIFRDIPITRTTDFPTSGPFNVASLNTELDKLTAVAQQNETSFSRTLQLSDSDETVDLKLPNKDTRKSKTLAFNATTGVPEAGPSISDVQTVSAASADIAALADIEDGTIATDAISDLAAIKANVTTVAGIASNVTSVASNASNINSVAGNATNINTVAGKESEITSVAAKASLLTSDFVSDLNTLAVTDVINDINTLATSDIVSDLNTLATSDIVSDLNTLATSDIVSDINTLATSDIVTDLNLLATSDFVSDLNTIATTTNVNNLATVAGAVSNVNTVAGISSDVTAVAGISSDVAAVEDIAANVTSVAGNASNINAAVSNASNINAVVSNASNINSVAGIAANVTTVAGIASNVTTVAGAASNVSTVAGAITNVNNVGGSIANVNTVATNISGVNSFAERYRVGSSDPSSSLDAGDLAYNTSDNALKYYTGSAWASITAGIGNVVEDTSPQLGGDLQSNGHDIVIADTDNIYVGTSNDGLKIHHSNNNSFIEDVGTGNFLITTNGNNIQLMKNQAEQMLVAKTDGSVELYYDNAKKFETSSSGVSVTGGVVASGGLSIDSYADPSNNYITLRPSFAPSASGGVGFAAKDHDGANNDGLGVFGHDGISFTSGGSERMRLTSGGNLGIGTTSPSKLMHLSAGNDSASVRLENTANSKVWEITPANPGVANSGLSIYNVTDDAVALHVDNSNNVGIGTASPTSSSGGKLLAIETTADEHTNLVFNTANTGRNGIIEGRRTGRSGTERFAQINIQNNSDGGEIRFYTAGSGSDVSERARFDDSANFLVGATSLNDTNGFTVFPTGSGSATMVRIDRNSNGTALQFRQGQSAIGTVSTTTSGVTYNTTSDIRLKQDIEPLQATDKLMQMNPVSYAWKSDPDGPRSMGFIAQEMQEVMPEAVSTGEDDDAMMSMDYGRITPILVSALQDAHKKIEELESRIAAMESKS